MDIIAIERDASTDDIVWTIGRGGGHWIFTMMVHESDQGIFRQAIDEWQMVEHALSKNGMVARVVWYNGNQVAADVSWWSAAEKYAGKPLGGLLLLADLLGGDVEGDISKAPIFTPKGRVFGEPEKPESVLRAICGQQKKLWGDDK